LYTLSICLPVCLRLPMSSLYLSSIYLSIYLHIYIEIYHYFLYISSYSSSYLSIYLSVCVEEYVHNAPYLLSHSQFSEEKSCHVWPPSRFRPRWSLGIGTGGPLGSLSPIQRVSRRCAKKHVKMFFCKSSFDFSSALEGR